MEFAYETEIPERPRPIVRQYRIPVSRCAECGAQVRGHHPNVSVDQRGATAHRVGDRVMAAAHTLHYGLGVPMRKVPAILKELSGVSVTQSALWQDARRRSDGEVGQRYGELRRSIRQSERVHTDDTGWRVDGKTAHLMGFVTDEVTVYQIRERHRNKEVRELIPADYREVMCTDRGKSYDAKEFDGVKQQKCIAHIQRSIKEVLEGKRGRARDFGESLKGYLKQAVELWHPYAKGEVEDFKAQAQVLIDKITPLICGHANYGTRTINACSMRLAGIMTGGISCGFCKTHGSSPPLIRQS